MERQEIIGILDARILQLEAISDSLEKLFYEINLPNQTGDESFLVLRDDCNILLSKIESVREKYVDSAE